VISGTALQQGGKRKVEEEQRKKEKIREDGDGRTRTGKRDEKRKK